MQPKGLQSVNVGAIRLAYLRKGKGEMVVFVHGIPTDYRAWDSQIGPFSDRYDVISYSRRLAKPNQNRELYESSTIENNSSDLTGLIHQLSTPPVHLVGHSYGGFIAAFVSATHPELVKTLTLIEPAVSTILIKNRKNPFEFLWLLFMSPSTALSAARFQLNSLNPCLTAFKQGNSDAALRLNLDGIMNRKNALESLPDSIRTMMKENENTVGELVTEPPTFGKSEASRITAPVLLMHGSDSPKVFHTIVERLAAAIPKSEVLKITGSSHFPHFEKPREFNQAVLDFIGRSE